VKIWTSRWLVIAGWKESNRQTSVACETDTRYENNGFGLRDCCQIKNGFFVHHFSPSGLQQIDKNVVFVVDTSESVSRERLQLEQVKSALHDLLDLLQPGDLFNVVAYSSSLIYWNSRSIVSATSATIASAKSFVASLNPSTGLSTWCTAGCRLIGTHGNGACYLNCRQRTHPSVFLLKSHIVSTAYILKLSPMCYNNLLSLA